MLSLHFQWDIHTSSFSQGFSVFPTINSKSFEEKEQELFLSLYRMMLYKVVPNFHKKGNSICTNIPEIKT